MISGIAQSATATSRTCCRVGQDLTPVGLPAREDAKRISGISAPRSTPLDHTMSGIETHVGIEALRLLCNHRKVYQQT